MARWAVHRGLHTRLVLRALLPLFLAFALLSHHRLGAHRAEPAQSVSSGEDTLVFGTTNGGSANFALVTRSSEQPHFSGFALRKDTKARPATAGHYVLGGLSFNSSLTSYAIGSELYGDPSGAGSVKIAKGEAIYVGHLVFDRKGNSLFMRVEDRFDLLRRQQPPSIASRLQKRLIQLPAKLDYGRPIRSRN